MLGYGWLMLLGTAFAYFVWTRGIGRIGASATYLALASPVVATPSARRRSANGSPLRNGPAWRW
jgi:drug/metabolite transporter (DMT)-like permease